MNQILWKKKSNHSTKIKFSSGVPYISYTALENIPWICHGFSTRIGGVSEGYLSSMNLKIMKL